MQSAQSGGRSSRTGMPLRIDMLARRSRSASRGLARSLLFAPPAVLARCHPPLWPQPCGTAIVPLDTSSVTITGARIEPVGDEMTQRSEEHTSELQSLMRISYAVLCLNKKNTSRTTTPQHTIQSQH